MRSPTQNERLVCRLGPDAPARVLDENVVERGPSDSQSDHMHVVPVAIQTAHQLRNGPTRIANGEADSERFGCHGFQGLEAGQQAPYLFVEASHVFRSACFELERDAMGPESCLEIRRRALDA